MQSFLSRFGSLVTAVLSQKGTKLTAALFAARDATLKQLLGSAA